jgi:hypothetical protein
VRLHIMQTFRTVPVYYCGYRGHISCDKINIAAIAAFLCCYINSLVSPPHAACNLTGLGGSLPPSFWGGLYRKVYFQD